MARIVAVHGVGHQFSGAHALHAEWMPALRDGLARAGRTLSNDEDFACAYYGHCFRPAGARAFGDPPYDATDVADQYERDLLSAWWAEVRRTDSSLDSGSAPTRGRVPAFIQTALDGLCRSPFFSGLTERALIASLKQVSAYFHDEVIHNTVIGCVEREVSSDTTVLVGHSLGSVVAYEALCVHHEWPVRVLVTLGSPLGVRNLVFEKLRPTPVNGRGAWPPGVDHWFNVADEGDVFALVKTLRPLFGQQVVDAMVDNGARAHDARRYLTAYETGAAIAVGL